MTATPAWIPDLAAWAEPAASWMLTYALHSTLLLAGAWCLGRLLKDRRLPLQETAWKVALVGGLITATLQLGLGLQPLAGTLALPTAGTAATLETPVSIESPEMAGISGGVLATAAHPGVAATSGEPMAASGTAPAAPVAGTSGASASGTAANAALWPLAAVAVWLAVATLLLLALTAGYLRLARRLRDRRPVSDGALAALFGRLLGRARRRRPVRLTATRRLDIPIAWGVVRGEITLPADLVDGLSPYLQESILAHELSHLLRRDPAWLAAGRVIECALFFQPLNRVARRRLQEIAEYRCDDRAVELTGRPLELARCLTEVAAWRLDGAQGLPVSAMASRSGLGARVRRLADRSRQAGERLPRWVVPTAGALLLLVAIAAPGVTGQEAPPPPEAPEAPPAPEVTPAPEVAPAPAPPVPPAAAEAPTAPAPVTAPDVTPAPEAPPAMVTAPARPASPAPAVLPAVAPAAPAPVAVPTSAPRPVLVSAGGADSPAPEHSLQALPHLTSDSRAEREAALSRLEAELDTLDARVDAAVERHEEALEALEERTGEDRSDHAELWEERLESGLERVEAIHDRIADALVDRLEEEGVDRPEVRAEIERELRRAFSAHVDLEQEMERLDRETLALLGRIPPPRVLAELIARQENSAAREETRVHMDHARREAEREVIRRREIQRREMDRVRAELHAAQEQMAAANRKLAEENLALQRLQREELAALASELAETHRAAAEAHNAGDEARREEMERELERLEEELEAVQEGLEERLETHLERTLEQREQALERLERELEEMNERLEKEMEEVEEETEEAEEVGRDER